MKTKNLALSIVGSLTIICSLLVAAIIFHYFNIKKTAEATTLQKANQELDRASDQLYDHFLVMQNIVQELASRINAEQLTEEQLAELLQKTLETQTNFESLAIAYQPFVYDPNKRLFSMMISKKGSSIKNVPIAYDYTQSSKDAGAITNWYTETINQGAHWLDPYFGKALKKQIIVYSMPIYSKADTKHKIPIGVLSAVLTPAILRNSVNSLSSINAGFGFVVSKTGTTVVHPTEEYVRDGKTLMQIAIENKNDSLRAITPTILSTPTGTLFFTEILSNKPAALLYRAISGTNIILGTIIPYAELLAMYGEISRQFLIVITFLITLILIGFIIIAGTLFSSHSLRTISIATSATLFLCILTLCYIERSFFHETSEGGIPIIRQTVVDKVASEVTGSDADSILRIKTGILINNIEYTASTQVRLTGYLWQYYPPNTPDSLPRDFLLSDCSESCTKKILAHEKNKEKEFILWFFTGRFNQMHFTSRNFPFDEQNIYVAINHPSQTQDLFVEPDLSAYRSTSPRELPGIAPTLKINDRFLLESYFLFKKIPQSIDWQPTLETTITRNHYRLYFTIISERYLAHATLVYLLPVFVAFLFLHLSLVWVTINKKYFIQSISLASSIFLAMTWLHSSLRKDVGISGICYLEYYYILLYATICFIITDTLLYGRTNIIARVITYEHNRWALALLTPIYFFIISVISALTFYF